MYLDVESLLEELNLAEEMCIRDRIGGESIFQKTARPVCTGSGCLSDLNDEFLSLIHIVHERAAGGQRTASGIYAVSCPHRGPDGEGIFPSEPFDGADQNAGQKHGEEDVMVAVTVRG